MKIISKNLNYVILTLFFTSCSSSEFIVKKSNINTNHWVIYKQPKNGKKLLASLEIIKIFNEPTINFSFNLTAPDSVEIITKTGRKYTGKVVKSDFDGYFLKIGNEREIFINHQEIKIMKKLENISTENKLIETTEIIQEEKKSFKETKAVENERKKLNLMPIFKGIGATLFFILTL